MRVFVAAVLKRFDSNTGRVCLAKALSELNLGVMNVVVADVTAEEADHDCRCRLGLGRGDGTKFWFRLCEGAQRKRQQNCGCQRD